MNAQMLVSCHRVVDGLSRRTSTTVVSLIGDTDGGDVMPAGDVQLRHFCPMTSACSYESIGSC